METILLKQGVDLYLDLMKNVLTNTIYRDPPQGPQWSMGDTYDHSARTEGKDWPSVAHTMVGTKRLDHLRECLERIIEDEVDGDLIEAGVWRGGACIFMRAVLEAYEIRDKRVWVADSFQGMPFAGEGWYPGDQELEMHGVNDVLAVPESEVKENFRRYHLLDDQVEFLSGWFSETLPSAPIKQLALLRMDGDLYESTMATLVNLYPKLSIGGYVIVDDYNLAVCRKAVHDYRADNSIEDEILPIDSRAAYWRRSAR